MTTLDPTAKSAFVTLSNGDLTVISNIVALGAGCRARSTTTRNDARYTEITIVSVNSEYNYVGVCNSTLAMNGFGFSDANLTCIKEDGAYYVGGAYAGSSPAFGPGDIVSQEIDPAQGVRWRVNGGTWTPYRALPSGTDFYCLSMVTPMDNGSGSGAMTWNFGAAAFAYTPTASAWDAPSGPVIISRDFRTVYDDKRLSHPLHADAAATWSIVGGADQADFEIVGNLLRWAGNISQSYDDPADSDTNNTYVVTVRATSGGTTDQTITITVAQNATGVAIDTYAEQDNNGQTFFDNDLAGDLVALDYFGIANIAADLVYAGLDWDNRYRGIRATSALYLGIKGLIP